MSKRKEMGFDPDPDPDFDLNTGIDTVCQKQ